jgi:hypothetical protein
MSPRSPQWTTRFALSRRQQSHELPEEAGVEATLRADLSDRRAAAYVSGLTRGCTHSGGKPWEYDQPEASCGIAVTGMPSASMRFGRSWRCHRPRDSAYCRGVREG